MKKIIITALVLCSLSACSSFLDQPAQGLNTNIIFSNEGQALAAVNGVYNAATYSINLWKFGDVASDDAVKGGNPGDQSEINYIDNFSAKNDNGVLYDFWKNTYETIARANNVIAGVPNVDMDATTKARFIGEAKFLRAYSYFQLVNIFGKVPLKLLPQTSADAINVPLSETTDIYVQIEKDLADASTSLPANYSDGADAGRATSGAAYGLLAKAQLYEKKYTQALASIASLDAAYSYTLESNYSTLFQLGNGDSPETVFAIRFLSAQNPALGNSLNQYFAPAVEGGYYFDAPTQSYVDVFTEKTTTGTTDPRLDASIGRDGQAWINGNVFSASWAPTTGYLVKKHDQPLSEVAIAKKGDGGLAYIYMRYADVLLMKAECLNELNQPAQAIAPLNLVRARVGLAPIAASTAQTPLRDVIRDERRKEFGFEFHRFFDIMRYGQAYAETALTGTGFQWVSPRFYYPIPQAEIDTNSAIN